MRAVPELFLQNQGAGPESLPPSPSSPLECTAEGQKAWAPRGLTYLVRALVTAAVATLHGVAPGHPHLSPHHDPGGGGTRFLHQETAAAHGEGGGELVQDSGKSLQ